MHHMVENFAVVVAGIALVGNVFPFPTFVFTCLFGAGRVLHQIGYTKGYGSHGIGFMLHKIASAGIEGLALIIALRGFGLF